jgi:hypothetical protein
VRLVVLDDQSLCRNADEYSTQELLFLFSTAVLDVCGGNIKQSIKRRSTLSGEITSFP